MLNCIYCQNWFNNWTCRCGIFYLLISGIQMRTIIINNVESIKTNIYHYVHTKFRHFICDQSFQYTDICHNFQQFWKYTGWPTFPCLKIRTGNEQDEINGICLWILVCVTWVCMCACVYDMFSGGLFKNWFCVRWPLIGILV